MDEQDRSFRAGGIDGGLVPQEQLYVPLVGPVFGAGQALGKIVHQRASLGIIAKSRIRQKVSATTWVQPRLIQAWRQRTYTVFYAILPGAGCERPALYPAACTDRFSDPPRYTHS